VAWPNRLKYLAAPLPLATDPNPNFSF